MPPSRACRHSWTIVRLRRAIPCRQERHHQALAGNRAAPPRNTCIVANARRHLRAATRRSHAIPVLLPTLAGTRGPPQGAATQYLYCCQRSQALAGRRKAQPRNTCIDVVWERREVPFPHHINTESERRRCEHTIAQEIRHSLKGSDIGSAN